MPTTPHLGLKKTPQCHAKKSKSSDLLAAGFAACADWRAIEAYGVRRERRRRLDHVLVRANRAESRGEPRQYVAGPRKPQLASWHPSRASAPRRQCLAS